MNLHKVNFPNHENLKLAGRLELPADQQPHNFAIFAHCFTCTKNLLAVKNVSRALTAAGFGVLRFDFTGLGESEGDFENTNFSGNVEDLLAAAKFLEKEYKAPTLLIGHSLGGTAVLMAAAKLASIKAVVTINAPSDPEHVKNHLEQDLEKIEREGKAQVNLSGRPFTIRKHFLDDLKKQPIKEVVGSMRKALLILHSPQDATVSVNNAEEIYMAAHHPKSFVSLDGADHLLSRKEDSEYAGNVIAGWASRYMEIPERETISSKHDVVASLNKNDGFTTDLKLGTHYLTADEPTSFGGNDYGPTPYELVSSGLAACTVMTLQMYAKRKGWDVQNVQVHISYNKQHAIDCKDCEAETAKIDTFTREIKFEGNLDEKQLKRLLQIADKCPVHKTLHSETQIVTKLIT
ncbi:bifunctional alpha/beta hydrolase/OsmC family protein [Rasiella sp. SM2506]|uniref:bifunctional alpha/beta hydrolase/OsmC family protein n=1 Tax=Rasiella sp. SM2506 TaxID=3423914 RepID=UPI003D7BF882